MMVRKRLGDQPLTAAERSARRRARQAAEVVRLRLALLQVLAADNFEAARSIAREALKESRRG